MLYYDRIDVSEGTDVNKTSASKDCGICNRCHNLLIMSIKLSDIANLNIKGSDYCYIISLISKNADLTEKSGRL